MHYIIVIEQLI